MTLSTDNCFVTSWIDLITDDNHRCQLIQFPHSYKNQEMFILFFEEFDIKFGMGVFQWFWRNQEFIRKNITHKPTVYIPYWIIVALCSTKIDGNQNPQT